MQGSMRPRSATAPTASATLHIKLAWTPWFQHAVNIRDGSEHALVDTEHEIGNPRASHRRRTQHIHQTEVIQCANVLASLVRKG